MAIGETLVPKYIIKGATELAGNAVKSFDRWNEIDQKYYAKWFDSEFNKYIKNSIEGNFRIILDYLIKEGSILKYKIDQTIKGVAEVAGYRSILLRPFFFNDVIYPTECAVTSIVSHSNKASVIFHEIAHITSVATGYTQDLPSNYTKIKNLDRGAAMNNAYAYEYYAVELYGQINN